MDTVAFAFRYRKEQTRDVEDKDKVKTVQERQVFKAVVQQRTTYHLWVVYLFSTLITGSQTRRFQAERDTADQVYEGELPHLPSYLPPPSTLPSHLAGSHFGVSTSSTLPQRRERLLQARRWARR